MGSRVWRPVDNGSVSATSSPSPSPRNRTTRRYSRTGSIRVSTPSTLTPARSFSTSFSQTSVAMRPARRSVTRPSASIVQKLPRIATSFGPTSTPIPSASSTPRPMSFSSGSKPNRPRWPGPEPGVIPGATGVLSPTVPSVANLVQVRRPGGLQLGLAARLDRQATEAVGHEHHDLGLVRLAELAEQVLHRHARRFPGEIVRNGVTEGPRRGHPLLA